MMIFRPSVPLLVSLLLSACATQPPLRDDARLDLALQQVGANVSVADVADPEAEVAAPDHPVETVDAVSWALRHHPDVQIELAEFDGAVTRRWQAGLLPNPMLSAMALREDGGGWMLEYGLMQSLLAWLERPRRISEADAALTLAEAEATQGLLAIARRAEAAQIAAVAAEQRVAIVDQQIERVGRQRELLAREVGQGGAGRLELLALDRRLFDIEAIRASAAAEVVERRAALASAMGLRRAASLRLPTAVPEPPAPTLDAQLLHALAARQRPELRAAGAERERADAAVALRRFNRGVDAIEIGVQRRQRATGPELRLALPVFDQARARSAEAEAVARAARARELGWQRTLGIEVEQALLGLAARQRQLAAADRAQTAAQRQQQLAESLHAAGALNLSARLAIELEALSADLAVVTARERTWQSLLALAKATASTLAAPANSDDPR